MADLHSKILEARPPPPGGPNSFNFMQFLGKFGNIVCWRPPPPESWRPLLGEILDPPLKTVHKGLRGPFICLSKTRSCAVLVIPLPNLQETSFACFHRYFWFQCCKLFTILGQSVVNDKSFFYYSTDMLHLLWLLYWWLVRVTLVVA